MTSTAKPENALKMAELEYALGVTSTYYFRYPYTFIPEIIEQILSLGHEVGYHYEVLAKARGDYGKAIDLFARELEEFQVSLRRSDDLHAREPPLPLRQSRPLEEV
jgi:MoaA/NifB/PqqE/SkfB family radical SAM enzyme